MLRTFKKQNMICGNITRTSETIFAGSGETQKNVKKYQLSWIRTKVQNLATEMTRDLSMTSKELKHLGYPELKNDTVKISYKSNRCLTGVWVHWMITICMQADL